MWWGSGAHQLFFFAKSAMHKALAHDSSPPRPVDGPHASSAVALSVVPLPAPTYRFLRIFPLLNDIGALPVPGHSPDGYTKEVSIEILLGPQYDARVAAGLRPQGMDASLRVSMARRPEHVPSIAPTVAIAWRRAEEESRDARQSPLSARGEQTAFGRHKVASEGTEIAEIAFGVSEDALHFAQGGAGAIAVLQEVRCYVY